jgi:3-hydroxyisobutyrate dehydrogenase
MSPRGEGADMGQIGFIGLGNMGAGMAARQAGAGHRVTAFDLNDAAVAAAVAAGCVAGASAADAVMGADVVFTMLPAGSHVRAVYSQAILPHAKPGALVIDCSTIDPADARAVAAMATEAGLRAADAPVSGGMAAAQAGTLAFMVGCVDDDFSAVRDALAPMARAVIHTGAAGSGQAAKICNNMLLAISMIGVSEAFVLADHLGLDRQKFFEVASQSSGQCWSLTSYCPVPGPVPASPANHGYQPGFAGAMMLKDLKLAAVAAGSGAVVETPLGAHALRLYQAFIDGGGAGADFSAVFAMLSRRAMPVTADGGQDL